MGGGQRGRAGGTALGLARARGWPQEESEGIAALAIVAFAYFAAEAAAAELAKADQDDFVARTKKCRDTLEESLKTLHGVHIYGQNAERVSNTTLFSVEGLSSETLLMALDLDGIAVSNGSACSSGKVEPSHVLKAMGASDEAASGAIRVSTGWKTENEDIEAFLKVWHKLYERMKDKIHA